MSKTGAVKVSTDVGPVWCHFSEQGDTLKLRRFESGAILDFDTDGRDADDRVSLSDCKKIVPDQASYSIERNPSVWVRILNALQAGYTTTSKRAGKVSSSPLIVPVTRLRRYYSSMKVFDKALFHNLAEFYRDTPAALEELWNDSRKQFTTYSNNEGWDGGKREKLPDPPQRLVDISSTYEFTSFIKHRGLADTGFVVVNYEINPWRTRHAMFSTKQPATKTGRGGIDLLMRSLKGMPVVAEIKVKDDKNAFFGLLQAMTYAVELSTPNQFERLRTHIPLFKDLAVDTATVEIAVIKVNPVNDPTLIPTLELIRLINERAKCGGLARIRLFQNEGNEWTTGQ